MKFKRVRRFILVAVIGWSSFHGPGRVVSASDATRKEVTSDFPSPLSARIATLISQLGSEHYASRRQAQEELQRIGVPALDQLRAAMFNSDPQIATVARFLVRSNFINWTKDNDPLEVRKLLEAFGTGDISDRADRIERLATMEDDRGLSALLRIARLEVEGILCRHAAYRILSAPSKPSTKDKSNNQRWSMVLEAASQGENQACEWLTEFARCKQANQPIDPIYWKRAVEKEFELYGEKSGETDREFLQPFVRFVSEQLVDSGFREDGLLVAKRLLDIQYPDTERIQRARDLSFWALAKKLPEIVVTQHEQPWMRNLIHTQMEYLLAESYSKLGDDAKAQQCADKAYSRGGNLNVLLYDRLGHAEFLLVRQQYAWSEREYRAALQSSHENNFEGICDIAEDLASMLADGLDYPGAVKVLEPIIERIEKTPAFAREIDSDRRFNPQSEFLQQLSQTTKTARLRSKFLYWRALDKIRRGELDSAKPDLREALIADPENIDVAIVMWKNRGDDAWNRESENAVQQSIRNFQETLPKLEKGLRNNSPGDVATYQKFYAITLNSYAWLLVCTDRELSAALKCSELACRLMPGSAAHLDTLARCYFRSGRIEEAIATQKEAIAFEPWSREIARSLDEYLAKP